MLDKKSKQNGPVSTDNYKGVRDFRPEDQKTQQYIFGVMREVAESFGYREYSASPLEPSELYLGKTSEEIVNEQTYIFTDRGGRSVTLRPEMTPTVARLVASERKSLSFPLRLYSIPNVFRYERPQRGRLREHYQLNVDLFGVAGIDAELETISLAYQVLKRFGLSDDQFEIRVNDRAAIALAVNKFDLDDTEQKELYRLLDRKDKISNFESELESIIGSGKELNIEASEAVNALVKSLSDLGINNVVFKSDLVRGFDYYTGIIFEIFDTNPENSRSLFGGGRYDNLLQMFGVESVPAVGFGMGDVTIRDVLESYDLLPQHRSFSDAYVCVLSDSTRIYGEKIAQMIRDSGLRASVDLRRDSLGSQIKRAEKEGAKFALFVGEGEMNGGIIPMKNLSTGEQIEKDISEIITIIKQSL